MYILTIFNKLGLAYLEFGMLFPADKLSIYSTKLY